MSGFGIHDFGIQKFGIQYSAAFEISSSSPILGSGIRHSIPFYVRVFGIQSIRVQDFGVQEFGVQD